MQKFINSLHRKPFLNCLILRKLPKANVTYQFRVDRPVYYPDRQSEMKRSASDQAAKVKSMTELPEQRRLPRDYYYKVLGVRKNASTQQIKAAYYALAKLFHPDSNQTLQESQRFQEISNAYHILTDDTRRLEYDQLGMVKDEQAFLRSINNLQKMAATAHLGGPVASSTSTNNKKKGTEISTPPTKDELLQLASGEPKLELTFLEAAHGLKKNHDLRFVKKCPACNGKSPKLAHRTNPELCRKCNGTGQLTKRTATYTSTAVCDQCNGRRFISRNQCETCDNRGIVLESTKVAITVPPGVKTGDAVFVENPVTRQRVSFRINVQDSNYYKRVGNDVHTDKYITISEAILGCHCIIHGIYENIEFKVEPGTESHTKVVIKGKGIKSRDGGVGDHIINIKIRIPSNLSMKQRQLVLAFAKTEDPAFDRVG